MSGSVGAGIVIDGTISPGEWDTATSFIIGTGGGGGTAITGDEVKVLATPSYVYALFNHPDSTDDRLGQNIHGNDQTSLNINPTAGGWGFPYDIIFQTGSDPAAWGGTSSGTIDGWETQWSLNVGGTTTQQGSLPADLQVATTYTGTDKIMEWCLPLNSIAPSVGDTLLIGGAIDIGDQNSYPYPTGLDWGDPDTFGETTVTPVPGTMLLLGSGLIGLVAFRKKYRKS
jgi:hypothetical protein